MSGDRGNVQFVPSAVSEATVISDAGGLSCVINDLSPTLRRGFKLEFRTLEWKLLLFPAMDTLLPAF
jgi:hypothetical protein